MIPAAARCSFSSTARGSIYHSAYRFDTVIIAYRWHPLHGQRLAVVRRRGRKGTKVIDVQIRQGVSRVLPAWMADEAACAAMSLGPPQVSVAALIDLRAVLSLGSTTSSLAESSDRNHNKQSDETITKAAKRTVHSGTPSGTQSASRCNKEARTTDGSSGSPAGSHRDGVIRKPSRKGGKR